MSIRIQLVTEKWNPISAAIRYTTRSWCSHAEFIDIAKGTTLGSRSDGGVKVRKCDHDHYSRVEQFVLNSPNSAALLRAAWERGLQEVGKHYDYSAIVGILFNRDIHGSERWFCSEFVEDMCMSIGFPLLSTRPSDAIYRKTPRDLLLSRQLVYIAGWQR